jgi:hypothetical protein
MWLVILLLILALIFGGIGLFVEALRWILIIALILVLVGVALGVMSRRGA